MEEMASNIKQNADNAQPDREDRPPVGARFRGQRRRRDPPRCMRWRRSRRRSRSCRRSPGRPTFSHSTRRSRRARAGEHGRGFAVGGLGGAQARRAAARRRHRRSASCRRETVKAAQDAGPDAGPRRSRHQADRGTDRGDHGGVPRAGYRLVADQSGDPAARQGDAAEREFVGTGVGDVGGADGPGRRAARTRSPISGSRRRAAARSTGRTPMSRSCAARRRRCAAVFPLRRRRPRVRGRSPTAVSRSTWGPAATTSTRSSRGSSREAATAPAHVGHVGRAVA